MTDPMIEINRLTEELAVEIAGGDRLGNPKPGQVWSCGYKHVPDRRVEFVGIVRGWNLVTYRRGKEACVRQCRLPGWRKWAADNGAIILETSNV